MAPMRCEQFLEVSSDWMDGERSPAAVAHVTVCSRCRAVVADFELIRKAGALLPEEAPSPRVWTAIKSQLEKEGLIRTPRNRWFAQLGSFAAFRPALAGAYLSLVVLGAILLSMPMKTAINTDQEALWLQRAQTTMAPLAVELSSAETKTVPAMQGPGNDVTAVLNHNLAIVDNMISMCEKSVREDPQNEMTRDYLYSAYQQKADLLATMAESAER